MTPIRIEQIELRHISMPLVAPFETSFGVETEREGLIVALRGSGLTGWGEVVASRDPGYSAETADTEWHILHTFIVPDVLGKEFADIESLESAYRHVRGHPMAKAGVQAALYDLLAKTQGVSLQTMLGGSGETVRVGVSVGIQPTTEVLVERVGQYLEEGYRRIKIKIKPGRDVQDAKAVRAAFPNILLQVDANSAYTLEDAGTIKAMDELNLLLIEQPLSEDDIFDHAKLQPQLKTAICLDESILSARHARWAHELGAGRIINIKPGRVGGLREAVRIHDYCASVGLPVWCGGMLETGVGRAANLALASLPNFKLPGDISATRRYWKEDIVEEVFELNKDGTITVPTGPGIGVNVNDKALEKVTVKKETYRAEEKKIVGFGKK
ncbi:MAG TPA: o-succinylbenzoate synthase [Anaerolineales bacterium]|nr:o-succinylbenzoate synthase [Anaerolineales bacterium]